MTQTAATRDVHPDPMVSSDNVEGTDVYGTGGDKVGTIGRMMIDKKTGNVAYVMMDFGGFLGLAQEEHPIPWKSLRYDEERKGFVTDITKEQLESAPARNDGWQRDEDMHARIYEHYGIVPYWF